MSVTIFDLPLSFRGAVGEVLDQAIDTLRELLDSLPAHAFVVEEKNACVIVRGCGFAPRSMPKAAAVDRARELVDRLGDSVFYQSVHPSEDFPEYHRYEIISLRIMGQEHSDSLPAVEISVSFERIS